MSDTITISIIGCGWLGLPLAESLVQQGFEVKGSTTTPGKLSMLKSKNITPFLIKLGENDHEVQLSAFLQSNLLIVNIPPGRRNPDVELEHFAQMQGLIEKAKNSPIKKVIFCSSTSVYGKLNKTVTEADMPQPETASGRVLKRIEQLWLNEKGWQTTVLRLAGLAGYERQPGRFLAGKKGLKDADAPVNLVHRDDVIRVINVIIHQNAWGQQFNVCADEHPSREKFYTHTASQMQLPPPEFIKEKTERFSLISNQKVKDYLQFTFRFPDPYDFI